MKILCLANSFKNGGRCIAGIELDANNNLKFDTNNKPIWIRPISSQSCGKILNNEGKKIKIFDVIEIENPLTSPQSYQSENTTFTSINVTNNIQSLNIQSSLDINKDLIFSNKGKAVHKDDLNNIKESLLLIETNSFNVYTDSNNKFRLKFDYGINKYDLPITDVKFVNDYNLSKNILNNITNIKLVLSLGVLKGDFASKLIASIIY
ncbi:hypothetical protein G1L02_12555 [Tenacibaculum finnmarkense]|uniref:dual OB domain-containing protein n=1 Tax=Tenacibaculum finnmarkense TaxID=2781243 RepID=UPI001EFACCB9|nr:hypothetical protein [Tenacibaculum finnmarkense]MCG8883983.1 hypothetical protein [Tenacibaculum finnmarkense]